MPSNLSQNFHILITKLKHIKAQIRKLQNLLKPKSMSEPTTTVDLTKPSIPISFPIPSLSDLKSRFYFDSFHFKFNVASVPLPQSAIDPPNRRRMLVCHDMMGGYVDDKFVQGGSNDRAYAIWHWFLIDVFVYFSHNLVTLPPVCWVNAAHTHGVKVLGTFIFEWDEGAKACKMLLSSKDSVRLYAELLVELASALGFDGWLINVEVKRLDVEQVANLKEFVDYLTKTMHIAVPGSLIIWYDSITDDGHLIYQNELNANNKPFFDLCDGIFTNYFWKKHYPKRSTQFAGNRKYDVYMGIDVFGRKTFGGGQWNTNIALDILKEDDISAAIFAPGWVYENLPKSDFVRNQNCWWDLVKKSWGILHEATLMNFRFIQILTRKAHPFTKPLSPFFQFQFIFYVFIIAICKKGRGTHISIKGSKVSNSPWNNISCQGFQPLLDEYVHHNQADVEAFFNFEDESYSGGGNITCKGSLISNEFFTARLFSGKLLFDDVPVHISYSVKYNGDSRMGLLLLFTSDSNTKEQINSLLAGDGIPFMGKLAHTLGNIVYIPINKMQSSSWIINEGSITMNGYILTDISLFCYLENQENDNPKLEESSAYLASLGHISIQKDIENLTFPLAESWSIQFQDISWSYNNDVQNSTTRAISLTIVWKMKEEIARSFSKYNIYVEKIDQNSTKMEFLGFARVESFYVSELEVPIGIIGLRFVVQVCGVDGNCQELDECPALVLAVESM